MKNIRFFKSENCHFLVVNLNRRVFVMVSKTTIRLWCHSEFLSLMKLLIFLNYTESYIAKNPSIYSIRRVIQKNQAKYCSMKLIFNQCSDAVVMSTDSEGLGAAVVVGLGSNLTQPSGISYFYLYTFFLKYLHQ